MEGGRQKTRWRGNMGVWGGRYKERKLMASGEEEEEEGG